MTLPPVLSDHLVLQRSASTAVWGKAEPGEKVKVSLGEIRGEATTGADGRWKVALDLSSSKEGPFDLTVEGANRVTVSDVLVGEVWLCSGQSNMAYTLNRALGGAEEIAHSANPRLRQFRVDAKSAGEPAEECRGAWVAASPATAAAFSAVGYYFAKDLQKTLDAPVGIVLSAWAGTVATAWTSEESLQADPELKGILDHGLQQEAEYPQKKADYVARFPLWEAAQGRQDQAADPAPFLDDAASEQGWKKVSLPGNQRDLGLPDAGAVWFRRTVTLSAAGAGGLLSLDVGGPHDFDAIYWNGQKIGGMTEATAGGKSDTRRYLVPKELAREGANVLAIRLFTPTDKGGFSTAPFLDIGTARTLLADGWQAKAEFELPPLTDTARQECPQVPGAPDARNVAGRLYNGMIAPLAQETLAGVVWYQGEQDTGRPRAQYLKMLQVLIGDWRRHWGRELPFVLCQLPNYGPKGETPAESRWAEIRQAQLEALALPKTAGVVLVDLGEKDVHPPDKRPVGERVALAALGGFYGKNLPFSGPVCQSATADGGNVILGFRFAEGGLAARPLPADYQPTYLAPERKPLVRHSPNGDLEGFALCGADRKWAWADARIEGETVVVSSPAVAKPVAVRYAWADNPTGNLYGASGLPASPFQFTLPTASP
ncbi:sialate O-acetylesterase [Verrucomicrobium sp. GAS474]|uniref:sialate O-acetylesterase n=1 Tax=Verrucomicrobium sp. GAS474 TaxID=1882831 RepID=UPI00138FE9E2|nr:sialate O-acetylesterase [Verrucomicrobium sp. GAS474]